MNIAGNYQPLAQNGIDVQQCQSCQKERKNLEELTLKRCSEAVTVGCCFYLALRSGYSWLASSFYGVLCAVECQPILSVLSVDFVNEYLKDRKCNHIDNLSPQLNLNDSCSSSNIATDTARATGSVDDRPSAQPHVITDQPEEIPDWHPRPIRRLRP